MIHLLKLYTLSLLCLISMSFSSVGFTPMEIDKIKEIINEMTRILEGNHKDILEVEDVLAHSSTQLRKARLKESLQRKMKNFRARLKDLKHLRSGFVKAQQLKEFIIGIDDRLNIMETNIAMLDRIYYPKELALKEPEDDDFPTFIDPGDPRYNLDQNQRDLARAIQKTRNILNLKEDRENIDDNFDVFVDQLDENLKAENKPKRRVTPAIGKNSIDHFHKQLREARDKDATFDWNEKKTDKQFREFFQDVEQFEKKPTINKRIVTGFPGIDGSVAANSRKTFYEMVKKIDTEQKKKEAREIVLQPTGSLKRIKGLNNFMNDIRSDGHKPTRKDFNSFIDEMAPVKSEVIMTYQKGIIKNKLGDGRIIQKTSRLKWNHTNQDFLRRLRNQRTFEQADEFWQGEQLVSKRYRRKTKSKVRTFSQSVGFTKVHDNSDMYLEAHANAMKHTYDVSSHQEFFTKTNSPHTHEIKKDELVKHQLNSKETLIPITVQLLDEDRVPFEKTNLQFKLKFSNNLKHLSGYILESGSQGASVHKVTDKYGEAKVFLLLNLKGEKIKVERQISLVGEEVTCSLIVSRDSQS
ncbi:MAG: hypothetical protein COB02_01595 [Candidatus Cloacimonadota bacterium]|nr:MAG: hypothetical protein COB02_01595 [Candidatus Cloacimonadota bacterium]